MSFSASLLNSFVPITQFNKGQAAKVFDRLKTERRLIVLKNNAPAAVILSPDEYENIMEVFEDAYLYDIAQKRIAQNPNFEGCISHDEFWMKLGIDSDDVDGYEDIEIE
ncbi:MAG: type II toxin-antitoxin system Phd/YefM family antitoxin [Oscillospiraceae bacterium]|jgi:PHD/YefM family antitoxin component YafN of YafNO toxin-antitoxin module|nr:type II toxin-antitoxin system Phd/YefM family antitoxin [Oscillospiraceae bacterium]